MIGFCPLASGSRGNAVYVGTEKTKFLIDAGISAKRLRERLAEIGVGLEQLDAILVSHEHGDHINAIKVLASTYQIPVFANHQTAKAICHAQDCQPRFKIFTTGESFTFQDVEVHPFSVQHDAADPVAFTITACGHKIGVCTDLGFVSHLVRSHLTSCDILYVEANHQPELVHASRRPPVYKQRVLGRTGHLSNGECGELVASVCHKGLKQVYLAHLSSECNTGELALQVVGKALERCEQQPPLAVAMQDQRSQEIVF